MEVRVTTTDRTVVGNERVATATVAGMTWRLPSTGGAVLFFAANLFLFRHFLHDDALISLRYVRHFVDNGELVWNLGERVEGYTNFLHVIGTATLYRLGLGLITAARSINFAAMALVLLASVRICRELQRQGVPLEWARLPLALLLCSAPLVVWCYGALEPTCVAAALGWATLSLLPLFAAPRAEGCTDRAHAGSATATLGLAYLARPDSVVFAAASLGAIVLFADRPPKSRLLLAGSCGLLLVAVIALHRVWAFRYYGDLLPNTFYAKTGAPLAFTLERGFAYLGRTVGLMPYLPVALAAFALALARGSIRRSDGFLAMGLTMHLAYVVWVGGDHMTAARFLVPVAIPAAVLCSSLAARLWSGSAGLRVALPIATFAAGLTLLPMGEDPTVEIGAAVGRHIATAWPSGSTVALHTAGSTPFLADHMTYIDMLGLNDRHIAHRSDVPLLTPQQAWPGHSRGDGHYVLSRKPDFIIAGPADGATVDAPWFLSDVELGRSAEFAACYRTEHAPIDVHGDGAVTRDRMMTLIYYRRICGK